MLISTYVHTYTCKYVGYKRQQDKKGKLGTAATILYARLQGTTVYARTYMRICRNHGTSNTQRHREHLPMLSSVDGTHTGTYLVPASHLLHTHLSTCQLNRRCTIQCALNNLHTHHTHYTHTYIRTYACYGMYVKPIRTYACMQHFSQTPHEHVQICTCVLGHEPILSCELAK